MHCTRYVPSSLWRQHWGLKGRDMLNRGKDLDWREHLLSYIHIHGSFLAQPFLITHTYFPPQKQKQNIAPHRNCSKLPWNTFTKLRVLYNWRASQFLTKIFFYYPLLTAAKYSKALFLASDTIIFAQLKNEIKVAIDYSKFILVNIFTKI